MIDVGLGVQQGREKDSNDDLECDCRIEGMNESTDFFSCTNTSVDLVDNFSADHLVENDPSTRIQHLFVGCPVRLALEVCILTWTLAVHADAEVVWLVDFRYSRRKFRQSSELIDGLVFPRGSSGRARCYRSVDSGERGKDGFCQRCRDCVRGVVVGSDGDVLPKSIVLLGEVCEKREQRPCEVEDKKERQKRDKPRSAISQSSSSTRRSSNWPKRSSSESDNSSSSSVAESTWSMYA